MTRRRVLNDPRTRRHCPFGKVGHVLAHGRLLPTRQREGRVAFSVCPLRLLRLLVAAIMPLEATLMIIDNSEYMRNGDYQPSRFDAQQDAVNTIFQTKIDSNPENTVGVMTMAGKGCVTVLPPQLRPRMTSLACVAQRSS